MASVRWNVAVSADTDRSLRLYLAGEGLGHKGDLSRFIEDAVRTRLFDITVDQAKAANAGVSEDELTAMIDEAVEWARAR